MLEPKAHKRRRRRKRPPQTPRELPKSYSQGSLSRRLRRLLRKKTVIAAAAAVVLALVGVTVLFIMSNISLLGGQSYETAHVRYTNGDFRGAVVALKSVLQTDPSNLAAQALLGQSYLRIGYAQEAEGQLRRSFAAGADLALLAEPLAYALLQQGKHETLLDTLQPDAADAGLRARIHTLRGDAHLQVRDLQAAKAAYTMALEEQFNFGPALLGQARVHLYRGEFKQADKLIAFSEEVGTHEADVAFMRGELARAQRQFNDAIIAYGEAITIASDHIPALLARAALLVDRGDDEAASKDLQVVYTVRPSDLQADYLRTMLLSRTNQDTELQQAWERVNRAMARMQQSFTLNHPPSLLLFGMLRYRVDKLDEAHELLVRFVDMAPYHMSARKLLAGLKLRQGLAPEALELLEPVFANQPNDVQVLALMSRAYMRLGEISRANELLARAVQLAPEQADIRAQLAMGWLLEGKRVKAIGELERAIELGSGASQAGALLGMVQLREGDVTSATTTAGQLLARWPKDPGAHNINGVVAMAGGHKEQALAHLKEALQLDGEYVTALHNLAQIALDDGDVGSAISHYERILAIDLSNTQAMWAMASIARVQGRVEDAIRWLEQVFSTDTSLLASQFELLELYLARGNLSQAWHLVQSMQNRFPDNVGVHVARGRVELATGSKSKANKTFKRLVKAELKQSGSVSVPRLLEYAKYLHVAGDLETVRSTLEEIVARAPDFLSAQAMFAELALDAGQFEQALAQANVIGKADPAAAIADRLAGDALIELGRQVEAKQAFASALAKGGGADVALKLFRSRQALGELDAALPELENWVAQHKHERLAQRTLGNAYIEAQRFDDALNVYEALNEQSPGDPFILNNLAGLYLATGDARALDFARRAHAFEPEHPIILDTLGWVLVQSDEIDEALPFLRDAFTRASSNVTIRYHLAVALSRLGRVEEAKRELEAVMKTGRHFFGIADAKALLQQLSN